MESILLKEVLDVCTDPALESAETAERLEREEEETPDGFAFFVWWWCVEGEGGNGRCGCVASPESAPVIGHPYADGEMQSGGKEVGEAVGAAFRSSFVGMTEGGNDKGERPYPAA